MIKCLEIMPDAWSREVWRNRLVNAEEIWRNRLTKAKSRYRCIAMTMNNYTYTYACRIIFNTITTSGHSSLEKYTSHFIERVVCERESETEQRLQHIDPHSSSYNSISFPFSWAAQLGVWEPSLCWDMVLIPASSLQLIWTSYRQGHIIIWHPPTSCECHNFTLNSTPRQSRSPLISWYLRPDAPVIYTGAFLLLTVWPESICNSMIPEDRGALWRPWTWKTYRSWDE